MEKKTYSKNPLIDTLLTIRGNQRVAIFTEPLYGIPFNLYMPFVSIYMASLGLSPVQIGFVAMLTMFSQMVSSLFGGVLADKMGRRKSLFVFDVFAWIIPYFLWATAQGFPAFVIAALLNGMWRISNVSYSLLIVEDADMKRLSHMYGLMNLATLLAGFISPLAYIFVQKFSLIPTMRTMYFFAMILMIVKNLVLYLGTYDTDVAKRRMESSKGKGIISSLLNSKKLFVDLLTTPRTLLAIGLMTCYLIIKTVNDSFWPLFVTDYVKIADENLSIFNAIRSIVMLLSTIFIFPNIRLSRFKLPLFLSFFAYVTVNIMYSLLNTGSFLGLTIGTFAEALALSIIIPMTNSILTATIEKEERAKQLSFAFMVSLLVSAPFSLIGGWLSNMSRILPLFLSAVIAMLGCIFTIHLAKTFEKEGNVI
ncbi:MAG TPA: MFS transporter [Christensenellaceae bacterium]|nr:MFS transporter [Christensenellaceae bacterium]